MPQIHNFIKNFTIFFIKVLVIHTFTYAVFGILFSNILDYSAVYSMEGVISFMKGFDSVWIILGPFLQPIRALIFAIVLYPLRETLRNSRLGWLALWGIFVGIGIIGTPSAAPGSIEGIIYTKLPIEFQLIGLPEVILQTFVFSFLLWVCETLPFKQSDIRIRKFFSNIFRSFVLAFFGAVMFSIAGIITFRMLGIDMEGVMNEKSNSVFLMAISFLTVLSSYFIAAKTTENKAWYILLALIYIAIYAVLPYFYNKYTDSVLNNYVYLTGTIMAAMLVIAASVPVFNLFAKKNVKNDEENTEDNDDKNSQNNNGDDDKKEKEDTESEK